MRDSVGFPTFPFRPSFVCLSGFRRLCLYKRPTCPDFFSDIALYLSSFICLISSFFKYNSILLSLALLPSYLSEYIDHPSMPSDILRFANAHPRQITYCGCGQPLQEGPGWTVIQPNPRTISAYVLKNSYCRLGVSNIDVGKASSRCPKLLLQFQSVSPQVSKTVDIEDVP